MGGIITRGVYILLVGGVLLLLGRRGEVTIAIMKCTQGERESWLSSPTMCVKIDNEYRLTISMKLLFPLNIKHV